jgi:hypothetical protein
MPAIGGFDHEERVTLTAWSSAPFDSRQRCSSFAPSRQPGRVLILSQNHAIRAYTAQMRYTSSALPDSLRVCLKKIGIVE